MIVLDRSSSAYFLEIPQCSAPKLVSRRCCSASTNLSNVAKCSQSGLLFAGCDATQPIGNELASATSYASDTWIYGQAGALTTYVFANFPNVYAGASIGFSDTAMVVGGTGSGTLTMAFVAYENAVGVANGYTPPQTGLSFGNFAISPPLLGGRFSFGPITTTTIPIPFTFGLPVPFSVGFGSGTSGKQYLSMPIFNSSSIYSSVQFPTFTIRDAAGSLVPGASVEFTPAIQAIPEPASWWIGVLSPLMIAIARRRKGRV